MPIEHREPKGVPGVAVVGLGFVGLPLLAAFWQAGWSVTGIDTDLERLQSLLNGRTYLSSLDDATVRDLAASSRCVISAEFSHLRKADAVLVCVPTPLDAGGAPDLSALLDACRSVGRHLAPGQLVVVESSTFPGTTEHYIRPLLEAYGLTGGREFFLAYSPERINPGSGEAFGDLPKVIGAIDEPSLQQATKLYSTVFRHLVPVSSTQVAELTKLVENTQRFIILSMMNELAMVCAEAKLDLWEAIDAAATKPYGFMAAYPGPGIGGHCIPVDPFYLQWFASAMNQPMSLIASAQEINRRMPSYVAERILKAAGRERPKVLLLGLTYKPGVNDLRGSASLAVFEHLLAVGVGVRYHDPWVPQVDTASGTKRSLDPLTQSDLASCDVVAILTDHDDLDYSWVLQHAPLVFDARGRFKGHSAPHVIKL